MAKYRVYLLENGLIYSTNEESGVIQRFDEKGSPADLGPEILGKIVKNEMSGRFVANNQKVNIGDYVMPFCLEWTVVILGEKEEIHIREGYKVIKIVSLDEEGIREVGIRTNKKNFEIEKAKTRYAGIRYEATKAYERKLEEIFQEEKREKDRINRQHASNLILMLESRSPQH